MFEKRKEDYDVVIFGGFVYFFDFCIFLLIKYIEFIDFKLFYYGSFFDIFFDCILYNIVDVNYCLVDYIYDNDFDDQF